MGISPISADWMWRLYQDGKLANCLSVIDFGGPQQLDGTTDDWRHVVKSKSDGAEGVGEFVDALGRDGARPGRASLQGFYGTLGVREYAAIDLIDEAAEYRADFNQPYEPERQFDMVVNAGTAEHVFNIGEAFRTMHNLLAPGGVALHVLPTYGAYYHGFYNIHSVLFRSLVTSNDYEMLNLSYAHDISEENRRFIANPACRLDDITKNEVKWQNLKFSWYYLKSILMRRERPVSLIHAAIRKTKESPFVFPQQCNKYAT